MSSTDEDSFTSEEETFEDKADQDEIEQQVEVPKDIELDSLVVGLACHPEKNQIAIGTIDGPVYIYTYSKEGNIEAIAFEHHKKPCRAVKFSASGQYLFTGSQDTTVEVIDLETSSIYRKFQRPNGSSIYSLLPIDNYIMATGEDDGAVVIWDFRMQAPVVCIEECNDYISSLLMSKERILLATSGEGTLSAINIRSRKLMVKSEVFECEFLSSAIIKDESKVVIGAGDGSLNIFNWGEYGNISTRFPGHPGSVDCLVKVAEDILCTGCEDGKIRVVQLFPNNRFLGVLGSHNGFSIDGLTVSFDKALVASSSYDQKVKFWDLSSIEDVKYEDAKETKKKLIQLNKPIDDFFSDLV